MSGRGIRERIQCADAVLWRDRVVADARSKQGLAAASEHEVTADVVIAAAEIIAAYIAAGETLVSRADLALSISARGMFRVVRFLVARRHIERAGGDLFRPIGARAGELR